MRMLDKRNAIKVSSLSDRTFGLELAAEAATYVFQTLQVLD